MYEFRCILSLICKLGWNMSSAKVHEHAIFRISGCFYQIACKSLFLTNITYWNFNRHKMTEVNILKDLLFTNEKMYWWMSAILFTMAFSWEWQGALRGYLLTVYTVSYILPLSQLNCRKVICSIIMYNIYFSFVVLIVSYISGVIFSVQLISSDCPVC